MKDQKKQDVQNFGLFHLKKDFFGHKQIWHGFASLEQKQVFLQDDIEDSKGSCTLYKNNNNDKKGKEMLTLRIQQNTSQEKYKNLNQQMSKSQGQDKLDIEEQNNLNEEQIKSEADFLDNPLLEKVEYLKIEDCQVDALNYFVTFLPFNIAKFELKKLKIFEIINSDIVGAHLAQIIFTNKHTIEHIRLINLRSLHFLEVDMFYFYNWKFMNRLNQRIKEYVILNGTSQIISALCYWINFLHQDELLNNLKEIYIDFNSFTSDLSPKGQAQQKKVSKITQISDSGSPEQNQNPQKTQLDSADIKNLQTIYKNFVSQKVVKYQYKNQQISKLKRLNKIITQKVDPFSKSSKDIIYSSFQVQKELNEDLKSQTMTYPLTSAFWRHPDLRVIWSQTEDFGNLLKHLSYRHIMIVATGFIGIISWPIYFLCIASDRDVENYEGETAKKKRIIQAKQSFVRSLCILPSSFIGYIPNIVKLTDSQYHGFLLAIYFLVNADIQIFLMDLDGFGSVLLNLENELPKEEKFIYEFSKYKVDFSCFYIRFMDDIRDEYFSNVLPIITSSVSKELSIAMNSKIQKIKNAKWRSGLMVCHRYLYVDKLVVSPLIKIDLKGLPLEEEPIFQFYEQFFTSIKNSKLQKLGVFFYYLVIAARSVLPTYYFCGYLGICTQFKFTYFVVGYSMWCLYIYLWVFKSIIKSMGLIMNKRLHSLSRLSELINIQNKKPLFFTPKELPSLNIFCVISVESWNNMRKFMITDCQSARNNVDILLLIIGTQVFIQALLLALDYFCLFDSKFEQQYIWSDFVLAPIIIFESLFYLGMILISLKKKADFNLYFQEFKSRFQTIISILKNFEFFSSLYYKKGGSQNTESLNKPVQVNSMLYDDDNDQIIDRFLEEQTFTGIEDDAFEDQGFMSSSFSQIFTTKSFQMLVQEAMNYQQIKIKSDINHMEQSEHEIVLQYIKQLSKQYKEMQNELQLDQELRSEMFLGIIPITYPIIKSLLIAILTFIGGFVVKYLLSLQQLKENAKN